MIKNRTTALLYSFYSTFGTEFMNAFHSISNRYDNVTLYLGDYNYKSYNNFEDYDEFLNDNIIFAKVEKEALNFERYLMLIETHQNFVTFYDSTFVFKLDEKYKKALRHLKKSEYSKMFSRDFIDTYFEESKFWYLKYRDEMDNVSFNVFHNSKMVSMESHREKWDRLEANNFYNKLIISPYHALNKSENLRELLSYIYRAEIPPENEFIEKIKLEKEILNYERKCNHIPCEEVV